MLVEAKGSTGISVNDHECDMPFAWLGHLSGKPLDEIRDLLRSVVS